VDAVARSSDRRSTLGLVLLALLAEEPMHPYRMQQMIKQRGKDRIANVAARNSVYQTIDRLLRASLIEVRETSRDERRPERTVYELTDAGRAALRSWLRGMLAAPAREFPEFPAALASLMLLSPMEVTEQLSARAAVLSAEVDQERVGLAEFPELPRLFRLDDEYLLAVREAELRWVNGVLEALRMGELTWSEEWIREIAEKLANLGRP
jgi:DNA-binding PadR family transcriptional regulator